jgi:hypothetical protein
MNTKPTNPKDAIGSSKIPYSTMSGAVRTEIGVAMLEGSVKYGKHNYRVSGVRASVYVDAAGRHMEQFWDYGEDTDPDSGLSHVTKAIASLVVLRDSMISGNWVDDRPPPQNIEHFKQMQGVVDNLIRKYPEPKKPHTNKAIPGLSHGVDQIHVGGLVTPKHVLADAHIGLSDLHKVPVFGKRLMPYVTNLNPVPEIRNPAPSQLGVSPDWYQPKTGGSAS